MASHPAPTRPDAIRRHNLAVILSHVHRDGALTRAQLTQRLGLSRSTIGALVADLTQLGLVEEVVPGRGDGVGRPSHTVAPLADGPFVVAVDINVTHVTVAAIGLGGVVLEREQLDTGKDPSSPVAIADLIAETVTRLRGAKGSAATLAGVGVSVPGTVDRRTGRVGVAPNLGWRDAELGTLIGDRLDGDVAVAIGNDADLAVLAEHHRGSARECEDVIYLLGRVGVGAGIIIGGLPLHGHDGHAGEIGHNVVDTAGPACHCGKHGCMETFVGDAALLRFAGYPGRPTDAAVAAVFCAALDGDASALSAVRLVAEALGRAIASLLNTLNPQQVLLGGSFTQLLDLARPELEASLELFALEAPKRSVTLARPAFGSDSALLGAAEIAFQALLSDPVGVTTAGLGVAARTS